MKHLRLPDWEPRLIAYLDAKRQLPHDWTSNNCAQLCAGAIEAMTGETLGLDLGFADEAAATAYLAERGGMEALVTAQLGAPLKGVLLAKIGDVLMAHAGADPAQPLILGVCISHHGAFVALDGLSRLRLGACVRAWRV